MSTEIEHRIHELEGIARRGAIRPIRMENADDRMKGRVGRSQITSLEREVDGLRRDVQRLAKIVLEAQLREDTHG